MSASVEALIMHVQRHDVRFGEQILQAGVDHARLQAIFALDRVAGDDAAAEAQHDVRQRGADAAGADDAHHFLVQIEAHQAVQHEVAFAHPIVGAVNLAVEREHQADAEFGDRERRIFRDAHDGYPQLRRRFEVHVVEAGAAEQYQADAVTRQRFQRGGADVVIDETADRGIPAGKRGGSGVQLRLGMNELVLLQAVGRRQHIACIRIRTVDQNFHDRS
jgi:hypothetical protein